MNREIKFRGKHITKASLLYPAKDEWVYGYFRVVNGECWINDPGDQSHHYMVDKKSVGEYAGPKDKNGKEIYEGDVVCIADVLTEPVLDTGEGPTESINHIASIEFLESAAAYGVKIKESGNFLTKGFNTLGDIIRDGWDIEIIGNKFDNPELLEDTCTTK